MRKEYITIVVLIILVGGAWLLFGRGTKLEAPATVPDTTLPKTSTPTVTTPKPASTTSPANVSLNSPSSPALKEFTVTGQNYSFSPSVITVKQGDYVKITFKNLQGTHDLHIDEYKAGTKVLHAGEESWIEFIAENKGTFQYYCSVGDHRAMGMWGTLKVE
jgi:plastocyanin